MSLPRGREIWVWFDIMSIPQRSRDLQILAIGSLCCYTQLCTRSVRPFVNPDLLVRASGRWLEIVREIRPPRLLPQVHTARARCDRVDRDPQQRAARVQHAPVGHAASLFQARLVPLGSTGGSHAEAILARRLAPRPEEHSLQISITIRRRRAPGLWSRSQRSGAR